MLSWENLQDNSNKPTAGKKKPHKQRSLNNCSACLCGMAQTKAAIIQSRPHLEEKGDGWETDKPRLQVYNVGAANSSDAECTTTQVSSKNTITLKFKIFALALVYGSVLSAGQILQ